MHEKTQEQWGVTVTGYAPTPDSAAANPIQSFFWKPSSLLTPYVDRFEARVGVLGNRKLVELLPARHDCFLEFYFGDRIQVKNVHTGSIHESPKVVLVGPHSERREDVTQTGTVRTFNVSFTPIGFRTLFGIPASSIANGAFEANLVVGVKTESLAASLADASVAQWRGIAERFLQDLIPRHICENEQILVAKIARELQAQNGAIQIAKVAQRFNRTSRQIERLFNENIGLSPKTFSRIARFNHALRRFDERGNLEQSSIALETGYSDQSHMIREFRALTGETPANFRALLHTYRYPHG